MPTPASDNEFPKILLVEGAAPSTPASGRLKLYAKTDGTLAFKDDTGAETVIGAGAADHIADTSDAHDASAVSIVDTGGYFTGTDVEAALAELGAAAGGGSLGGCRVRNTGSLNLNNGSRTTVTFDTEDWDDAAYHSGSGSELTVPATGRYRVIAGGKFNQGGATETDLILVKNRTGTPADIAGFTIPGTAVAVWASVAWEGLLTSGDTLSLQTYLDSSSRNLSSHYLAVERLT